MINFYSEAKTGRKWAILNDVVYLTTSKPPYVDDQVLLGDMITFTDAEGMAYYPIGLFREFAKNKNLPFDKLEQHLRELASRKN